MKTTITANNQTIEVDVPENILNSYGINTAKSYYRMEFKEYDYRGSNFDKRNKARGNFIAEDKVDKIKEEIEMYLFFKQFEKIKEGDGFYYLKKCGENFIIQCLTYKLDISILLPVFNTKEDAQEALDAWYEYKNNKSITENKIIKNKSEGSFTAEGCYVKTNGYAEGYYQNKICCVVVWTHYDKYIFCKYAEDNNIKVDMIYTFEEAVKQDIYEMFKNKTGNLYFDSHLNKEQMNRIITFTNKDKEYNTHINGIPFKVVEDEIIIDK